MQGKGLVAGLLMALILGLFPSPGQAAVPRTVSYQGYLTDAAGTPVSITVQMHFSLYAAAEGGTPLWSETQSVVVSGGAYAVLLGSVTPLALPFDAPYYLGVAVGAEEMAPRLPLASVPYALHPSHAGCNPGDFIYCFNGDPARLDVGVCKAGKRFCLPDGSGFSNCIGVVLPAAESCNELDDDCDGLVDNEAAGAPVWYADQDYDGYGTPDGAQAACTQPAGYVASSGDCDDGSSLRFPGGYEYCDGVDNDCNGVVDDNCGVPTTSRVSGCSISWPQVAYGIPGDVTTVWAQIYIPGITDVSPSSDPPGPGFMAQVGYGPIATSPVLYPDIWQWSPAVGESSFIDPDSDEYVGSFQIPTAASTIPYGYVYRFSTDNGRTFVYCDSQWGDGNFSPLFISAL